MRPGVIRCSGAVNGVMTTQSKLGLECFCVKCSVYGNETFHHYLCISVHDNEKITINKIDAEDALATYTHMMLYLSICKFIDVEYVGLEHRYKRVLRSHLQ